MEPERAYSDSFRLTGSRTKQLSSGFTPLRIQKRRGQDSKFLTLQGILQEKIRIQRLEQHYFQPKEERIRPNDPEASEVSEGSVQKKIILNTSYIISKPTIRNDNPNQNEHSVVTPESDIKINELWLQRYSQSCTQDDSSNTLQDVRKRTNIGKYSIYKSNIFKEKQPFRVENKHKPREGVEELTKEKTFCHNFVSTDHNANSFQKEKEKVYAIEKFPAEETLEEDSESDSMGYFIKVKADDDQDPKEELLVGYEEETQLEIQEIKFDSGAHCSIVAREFLDKHLDNWETQLFPTNERSLKSSSGKMASIGTIIKEMIINHSKGNIRLYPELVVLKDSQIQALRKRRPAFAIGGELLGKIRGHNFELSLDVERPYPPMLRRPPYPEILETRKEMEKHIIQPLDMDVIKKI
ncbi:hypothetical protein O181_052372 [Austropuccinia psidii MF-1]|uniref:Uncharacterized protein n=1 Tax=Austropuccinia psidii MF-1 TaxID=1389203 RepID=A0A9Q3E7I5_9BASI|nr:hypothetical protein [Austropuccinia psidii MF-1]